MSSYPAAAAMAAAAAAVAAGSVDGHVTPSHVGRYPPMPPGGEAGNFLVARKYFNRIPILISLTRQ